MTKNRFFNKLFFKETFRRYAVIGIVFACISVILGYSYGYGAASISSSPKAFMADAEISYRSVSSVIYGLLFIAMGIHAATRLRNRDVYELYGSIPISKLELWSAHFVAALAIGAAITLSNAIAFMLPIITRSALGTSFALPFVFIEFVGWIIDTIIIGLCCYSITIIICNITGNNLSAMLAALLLTVLPLTIYSCIINDSDIGLNIISLLIPVHKSTLNLITWLLKPLAAAFAIWLSFVAFTKYCAEYSGKPAKNKIIHAAIGIGWAATIALNISNITGITLNVSDIGNNYLFVPVLQAVLSSLLVYFLYMIITCKKFKKALKMLAYYPCVFAVFAAVMLLTVLARMIYQGIDFSAENIAYISIPGTGSSVLSGTYDHYDSVGNGVDGEEKVHITSQETIDLVSESIERMQRAGDPLEPMINDVEDILFGSFNDGAVMEYGSTIIGKGYIAVTLKNGCTYTLNLSITDKLHNSILNNKEYVDKATNLTRFENGRILNKEERFQAILPVLLEELESLDTDELIDVFRCTAQNDNGYIYYESLEYGFAKTNVAVTDYYDDIYISSRDYTCIQRIPLTNLTPKAAALYMQLSNEFTYESDSMRFAFDCLSNDQYLFANMQLYALDTSKHSGMNANFYVENNFIEDHYLYIDDSGEYYDYDGNPISYEEYVKFRKEEAEKMELDYTKKADWLSDIIRANKPFEDARYILKIDDIHFDIDSDEIILDEDGNAIGSYNKIAFNTPYEISNQYRLFVGLTEAQYNEMLELFYLEPLESIYN